MGDNFKCPCNRKNSLHTFCSLFSVPHINRLILYANEETTTKLVGAASYFRIVWKSAMRAQVFLLICFNTPSISPRSYSKSRGAESWASEEPGSKSGLGTQFWRVDVKMSIKRPKELKKVGILHMFKGISLPNSAYHQHCLKRLAAWTQLYAVFYHPLRKRFL